MKPSTAAPLEERNGRLWIVAASPAVWAAYFMLAYVTAAIWCAKGAGQTGTLGPARVAIAIYTVVALGSIALIGRRGWLDYRLVDVGRDEKAEPDGGEDPHGADSPTARHGFLGFATVLLSALSAVAVAYGALPIIFIKSCR